MSLAAYIQSRLLDSENPAPRRRGKRPVKDYQALAQVLGKLGQSRLSANLNQLARSANSGSLPVTPDTEAALLAAVADIREIRLMLMEAQNIEVEPCSSRPPRAAAQITYAPT